MATDITYIKLLGRMVYFTAIIDLRSRKILSWRLSESMDVSFCLDALVEAIAKYGVPAIFNTDCGSQYTSDAYTGVLEENGIQISMDGIGRCKDNIIVERTWRTLKYEWCSSGSTDQSKSWREALESSWSSSIQEGYIRAWTT